MATELAIPTQQATASIAVSRHTGRPLLTHESLIEEGQQRQLLMSYVKAHMVEGIDADYGIIPGTQKKTLLKPGAEKLVDLFRCYPEYTIEPSSVVDYDKPLFAYTITSKIYSRETGGVVCVGMGSCSSHESKYRWRNADRKCPACDKACIKRSKNPPRDNPQGQPGWYCYAKIGGCGANYNAGDQSIEGQATGRMENPDVADFANTILKIAKKRALVDAAIGLARCSDMFTQDVEDFQQPDDGSFAAKNPTYPGNKQTAAPVDVVELKRQLLRTGWGWAQTIAALNANDGTTYAENATPQSIDQAQLGRFLTWLSKEPDAPKQSTPTTGADNRTPTTEQPAAANPTPGQVASATPAQVEELLGMAHDLSKSWRQVREEFKLAANITPGMLSVEVYETIHAALTQQVAEKNSRKRQPAAEAAA